MIVDKPESSDPRRAQRLKWRRAAHLGLFVHYGLYSQLGRGEWVRPD